MLILTKKRFQFKCDQGSFISQGNGIIEQAPDWVAKTKMFALASAEGSVLEVKSHGRSVGKGEKVTAAEAEKAAAGEIKPPETPPVE